MNLPSQLALRIGLHSGPVTAGVLRGDNARFQLFGDTVRKTLESLAISLVPVQEFLIRQNQLMTTQMNTASRIETGGRADRIHVSTETANQLKELGKSKWVTKREDTIIAKGKGELQTYWLSVNFAGVASTRSSEGNGPTDEDMGYEINDKDDDAACGMDVHAKLEILKRSVETSRYLSDNSEQQKKTVPVKSQRLVDWNSSVIIDKLKALIKQRNNGKSEADSTVVTTEITAQVTQLVAQIALRYHDNPVSDQRLWRLYCFAPLDSLLIFSALFRKLLQIITASSTI